MLTSLNLYGNDIGPEGGKAIADALKSGTLVLTTSNQSWPSFVTDRAFAGKAALA